MVAKMCTGIELKVGPLSISYFENMIGTNHGILYQEKHRKRYQSEEVDYDYFEETGKDPSKVEMAFICSLKEMVPRLEFIGYGLENIKKEYIFKSREYLSITHEIDSNRLDTLLSFEDFVAFVTQPNLRDLDEELAWDFPQEIHKNPCGFWSDHEYSSIPFSDDAMGYSEREFFQNLCHFLSPYSFLRLLAENEANLSEEVIWHYGPLIEDGWAKESEFVPGGSGQRILIVTEGSSDAHIIKHALSLLRPKISDLFDFTGIDESYPFTGTGNLVKFAEGLIKTGIHKSLIFLFDNDAEGWEACEKIKRLNPPPNIVPMTLPEQDSFRKFPTKGPSGVVLEDINRRGAAIECYLDLDFKKEKEPLVTWKNFKEKSGTYQGALERKEFHKKRFLKVKPIDINTNRYNTKKIDQVLDAIIRKIQELRSKTNIIS